MYHCNETAMMNSYGRKKYGNNIININYCLQHHTKDLFCCFSNFQSYFNRKIMSRVSLSIAKYSDSGKDVHIGKRSIICAVFLNLCELYISIQKLR